MTRVIGSFAALGVCLAGLSIVTGAQARSLSSQDSFKTMRKSATTFAWSYTNHRAAGTPPVNGETIQITSGDPSILQSVTFDGVSGVATGVGGAFSFYPISVAPGATATGTGVTNAPLPDGTKFKYFVTTDGFASSANTFSVDSTLVAAAKPLLKAAKSFVVEAIGLERDIVHPRHRERGLGTSAYHKVRTALFDLRSSLQKDEIDQGQHDAIANQLTPVLADDARAERALNRNDGNSATHWAKKGLARKEIALRLIEADLSS